MNALQIISTGEYKEGYFIFSAQCTDGNFYDVAISKDEVQQHINQHFDAEFIIKDSEVFISDYADFCQIILESWQRSDNKDNIFIIYVTAQKKQYIEFIKKYPKGHRPVQHTISFPLEAFPTLASQKNFKKQEGYDSFRVVTK